MSPSSLKRTDTEETMRLLRRLERERRAREEAERLLEHKSSELYDANQKLEEEMRQVRVLSQSVDASRDGIALIDEAGHFSYMNSAYAAIFGYEPCQLLGGSWETLFGEAERERFFNDVFPQFEKEGVWRGEALGRDKTGQPVSQDVVLSQLPDGGTIYAVRDVTERRKREIYAREIEARLQKAEREAELFTLGNAVAHDFNNLIAAISGNVAMLKMELKSDPDNYHRVNQIDIAIQQAAGVIRSLELERTNDTKRVASLDLVELMQTGLQIAGAIKPAGIMTRTDFPQCARVHTNEVLLTRCLLNIAKNAFYAMNDEGLFHLRIAKTAADKISPHAQLFKLGEVGERLDWIVELTDNGIGITSKQVNHIFDGFYTTKPSHPGSGSGSGLGLESLKSLVQSGNVCVEVESESGVGTRFRFYFYEVSQGARAAIDTAISKASQLKVAQTHAQPAATHLNIMLVDDNALVGATVKEQIESRFHSVEWYEDPRDALSQFELAPDAYDVIITDLTMPHLSGHDLAAGLIAARADVPIILYSGQAAFLEDNARYAAILQKPVTIDGLDAALKQAISSA